MNWWDGLTEKQRKFCEAFAGNGGNAHQAALSAGYAKPTPEGVYCLRKPKIQKALEHLRKSTTNSAIMTREERQMMWTSVIKDKAERMDSRLKASELLGKAQGDFIDRVEVKNTYEEMPDDVRRRRIEILMERTTIAVIKG
jgi:phage terminase small subunit